MNQGVDAHKCESWLVKVLPHVMEPCERGCIENDVSWEQLAGFSGHVPRDYCAYSNLRKKRKEKKKEQPVSWLWQLSTPLNLSITMSKVATVLGSMVSIPLLIHTHDHHPMHYFLYPLLWPTVNSL